MKIFVVMTFALLASTCFGQTDCKPYIPFNKGAKWEITNYTAKGKVTGRTSFELVDKVESSDGVTFSINSIFYDKKGKEAFTNTFDAFCQDGHFKFDMAFKMDGAAMQSYQNMDLDIEASDLGIPSMDVAAGTALDDASIEVKVGPFNMTILITDRKVESKEEVKTPAGTFKCLQLSQKTSTKMIIKIQTTSKEWYAEGVGMIRSESYNKKGKLVGYSELTKLEKK